MCTTYLIPGSEAAPTSYRVLAFIRSKSFTEYRNYMKECLYYPFANRLYLGPFNFNNSIYSYCNSITLKCVRT